MRELVKAIFRRAGLSVRRLDQDTGHTLLGLRRRPILHVIDVGANEGQFARQMRGAFPRARITCFEPVAATFARLADWAASQQGLVEVKRFALSDEPGTLEMHVHLDHSASSSLLATTATTAAMFPQVQRQGVEEVPVRRLDDFALAPPPDGEQLLKLDVQGVEDRVLRGGTATLARTHHVQLEASIDHLYEGQTTFARLVAMLDEHGFEYRGNLEQAYAPDHHVVYVDALFGRRGS